MDTRLYNRPPASWSKRLLCETAGVAGNAEPVIEVMAPDDGTARWVLRAYFDEVASRYYGEELRRTASMLERAQVAVYPVDARGLVGPAGGLRRLFRQAASGAGRTPGRP